VLNGVFPFKEGIPVTLITVPGLADLRDLLETHERETPTLLLVGSHAWQYCTDLHSRIATLAKTRPEILFYEFDVDDYEEDFLHEPLMEIFSQCRIKYLPSQVLLPREGRGKVLSTANLEEIRHELAQML